MEKVQIKGDLEVGLKEGGFVSFREFQHMTVIVVSKGNANVRVVVGHSTDGQKNMSVGMSAPRTPHRGTHNKV